MTALGAIFACDRRALAACRLLLAVAVICNGAGIDHPLGGLILVSGTALLLGYRSSLSAFACWALLAALHVLNPGAVEHTDTLLVALLLLSVFLPIGACYSVDSALDVSHAPGAESGETTRSDPGCLSMVTVALCLLVLFTVVWTAALSLQQITTMPYWLRALNLVALVAPVPILLPVSNGWLRTTALMILLTLMVVAAPHIDNSRALILVAAGLLALLPGSFWSSLVTVSGLSRREEIRIFFDGDCGFCRKTCYLFRTFFLLGNAQIMPAQSDDDTYRILRREDSWVVYDYDGRTFIHWHAVLLLLRRSPVLWPLGWVLTAIGMGYWAKPIYRAIGASRQWLSKLTEVILPYRRELPPDGRWVAWFIGAWLGASLFAVVLPTGSLPSGEALVRIVMALGLDHRQPAW